MTINRSSIWLILTVLPFFAKAQKADFCISNVSIFKGNDSILLKNQYVLIKNGEIIAISTDKKTSQQAQKNIDGKGKFLMPGLWDMHVHFPSHDTLNWQKLHLYTGVLHLRSMRGNPKELAYAQRKKMDKTLTPDFFVSATPIKRSDELPNADSLVRAAKEAGFSHIKILSIRDSAQFHSLAAACRAHKLPFSGHFPTNIPMDDVFESGFNSNEHLGGLLSIAMSYPDYLDTMVGLNIKNRVFSCPTNEYTQIMYVKKITDCEKHEGIEHFSEKTRQESYDEVFGFKNGIDTLPAERQQKTRESLAKQWTEKLKLMRILHEKKALMLIGADNGAYQISGIWGLLQEMQHFSATGYSNFDILKIATYNGALYFDQAETLGVVQKGAKADLLLLDANPLENLNNLKKLSGVFKSGIFLDKKTLAAGLKGLTY